MDSALFGSGVSKVSRNGMELSGCVLYSEYNGLVYAVNVFKEFLHPISCILKISSPYLIHKLEEFSAVLRAFPQNVPCTCWLL